MEIHSHPDGLNALLVTAPEYDASFEVSGNVPVQASGNAFGRELYFRARHDRWSCELSDSLGNFPSDGYMDSDGFYLEGKHSNAGWMPHDIAVDLITAFLRQVTQPRSV